MLLGGTQHKTRPGDDGVWQLDMTEDDEQQLFAEKPALKQLYDAKVKWVGQAPCHGIYCAMHCMVCHALQGMGWKASAQATCTIPDVCCA